MEIKQLPVGQLKANCYLVWEEESGKGIVIDPGDDADFIIQKALDERVDIEAILATHGHFDHVSAVNELKLSFDVPLFMHSKDIFLLERMRETTKHYGGFDPGPPPIIDEQLDDATEFGFGSTIFSVIHTPGHTPGSVSLYNSTDKVAFVGDVLFARGGVGRTDFSYCSTPDLKKSISTLLALPDQTKAYSGHDDPFYVADERSYHPLEVKGKK